MKLRTGLAALTVSLSLVLAGCSGEDPSSEPIGSADPDAAGTLTVWLMEDGAPQSVIDEVNERFTEDFPDVEVTVELQKWEGIQDTLSAALADDDGSPDVVQVGSALTARLADDGQLADLTQVAQGFGLGKMLPGLREAGELDGHRYGIPFYGGVRVVVYNTAHFEKAGVTSVPKTLAALERAAAKLQDHYRTNKDYSAFYFPGADWYAALPFIWEAGGDIAVQDEEGTWQGSLDSPESRAGLEVLAELVADHSRAPADADASGNRKAFRTGDVGMMIDQWYMPGVLDTGKMKGKVGAFALPGKRRARTSPVYMSGSDLAVGARSDQKALAASWIRIATGTIMQKRLAKRSGFIPNREAAFTGHEGNKYLTVADGAATVSRFTPVTPLWGNVESAGVLPDMLTAIFSGEASVDEATSEAAEDITELLAR